ncbi:MAG: hypothetical protein FD180_4762 [Planctomycetota bacterium]|nr:MAG: hypothetical protein FD180_4762 [Planctomycetota bacterium]
MRRAAIAVLLFAARVTAEDLTLVRDGRAEAAIVQAKDATTAEERGARELREHLRLMSGAEIGIAAEGGGGVEIRVVFDAALGAEEYRLKTEGRRLTISGGRPRGVLYGCAALLDRLGVRWFSKSATLVPRRATVTVPPLDERGAPVFDYRHPYTTEALDADWAARNRVNGASKGLDASYGGAVTYSPFVHSFEQIVPGEMFGAHPEYFPMIDGKRSAGVEKGGKVYAVAVQRCLTNPGVVKLAIAKVRDWIREGPEAQVISVSQNDGDGWCECPACRKAMDKYGARSGVLLAFVNEVADAFPGRVIDTLAYGETEEPPKGISPRKNVSVRLCPIKVCHAHPLAECASPESAAFQARLKGWDELTDALVVWHYDAPFAHLLMPFPDFADFPADLRLYRKHGVRGVFFQGATPPGGGGSDAELRSWVQARLLWTPDGDADALVTEWMKGVYGAAWEPMRAWFDRLHRATSDPKQHLFVDAGPLHAVFSDDLLVAGDALFDQAEKLADTPAASDAVAKARLGLRYVKLARAKVPGADLDDFLRTARRFGVTQVADGWPIETWEAELRRRGK